MDSVRLAVLVCAALALGCASSKLPTPLATPSRLVVGSGDASGPKLTQADWATVQAIRAALREGDDVTARALTDRLDRSGGEGVEELVAGFRRVLEGREVVRALHLELVLEDLDDGRRVLTLEVRNDLGRPVGLGLPVGRLEHLLVSLSPVGQETRELETTVTHACEDVVLEPDDTARLEVLRYRLPMGGAIAVRERWRLRFGDGHVRVGGRDLPAADVVAEQVHGERLASELPTAPVEPEALVTYAGGQRVFLPLLLEHAVRIEPRRREEAVRGILPLLERLAVDDPDRGRMLAPALRWLTRSTEPGVEPDAWVRALRDHLAPPTDSDLDLPVFENDAR